jgi:hypothetical protein
MNLNNNAYTEFIHISKTNDHAGPFSGAIESDTADGGAGRNTSAANVDNITSVHESSCDPLVLTNNWRKIPTDRPSMYRG